MLRKKREYRVIPGDRKVWEMENVRVEKESNFQRKAEIRFKVHSEV